MSHSWKKRNHLQLHPHFIEEKKNKRHRYWIAFKWNFRYKQLHREAAAAERDEEAPGIRPRLLPPDPWMDRHISGLKYLKPFRHSRLERHRAARKAAIRDMDARLCGQDYSG